MTLAISDDVALITLDDGRANVVGHALIDQVMAGLSQGKKDAQAVVITGRAGLFSAGFDLDEIKKGPDNATKLVNRGAEMLLAMYCHPQPLLAACTGHAIAAGAFMLLSCDTRVGSLGDFKIGLNETAIGMSLPVFGHELASARLSKRHLTAAIVQSTLYDPQGAVDAGFLDEAVAADDVVAHTIALANKLGQLPTEAYAKNKVDSRAAGIAKIQASLN
ncbi:MAG: crotonase/enoyl-CoA hydratase family protein [Pseudomonadales bacterium]|nr:crotonase/enoyl-CoA hydratase family protein [Pseudomonadales bacterium]